MISVEVFFKYCFDTLKCLYVLDVNCTSMFQNFSWLHNYSGEDWRIQFLMHSIWIVTYGNMFQKLEDRTTMFSTRFLWTYFLLQLFGREHRRLSHISEKIRCLKLI